MIMIYYLPVSGVISLRGSLDRETQDTFVLTIRVSDGGDQDTHSLTADTTFTLTVLEVNEHSPQFTEDGLYEIEISENESPRFLQQVCK